MHTDPRGESGAAARVGIRYRPNTQNKHQIVVQGTSSTIRIGHKKRMGTVPHSEAIEDQVCIVSVEPILSTTARHSVSTNFAPNAHPRAT